MDSQRLEELINAAGYTAESYQHNGQSCVAMRYPLNHDQPPFAVLANIVYHCATPSEASDLLRRCYRFTRVTEIIMFWPHAPWVI